MNWYAISVKRTCEDRVQINLRQKGLDTFLPKTELKKQWTDRIKRTMKPLFPGYLFARFEIQSKLLVITTPHVISILGTSGRIEPIPDEVISSMQRAVTAKVPMHAVSLLRTGEKVRITDGALKGIEGIVSRDQKDTHVTVNIEALQQSVALLIDRGLLETLRT